MIQIYTDGVLAYDSRLREPGKDYTLLELKLTTGLNKGGTATITMPPGHPAYDFYTSYRTIVEIYRDGVLLFRGRALYPTEDFYRRRTVTCEGELCFFQDAVSRPYLYQDDPATVFSAVVATYNAQVEAFKQFKVGTVTVTDANDYIRLESENAEPVLDTVNKLLERCGGYIVFTTDEDGRRVVNWYAELGNHSGQVIEFGSNLLNYSRTGANTELATAVLPYGAKDEETGERLTIKAVNGGVDYIQDNEAVALRGRIFKTVTWDDVTEPANLLSKARKYLAESRQIVTSLELTAVDLSRLDKSIDSYQVGDNIRVRSKPHGLDDVFQLTERTEDLLDPSQGSVTLGKELRTLTGADVAGDNQSRSDLQKTTQSIKKEYTLNIQQTEKQLASLIEQKPDSITLEVTNGTPGQKAAIVLTVDGKTQIGYIDLAGVVTITDLATGGKTVINGSNITTGSINADLITAGTLRADEVKLPPAGNYWLTLDDLLEFIKPVAQSMAPYTQKSYSVSLDEASEAAVLTLSRGYDGDGFDHVVAEVTAGVYRYVIVGYSEGEPGTLYWEDWKQVTGEDCVVETDARTHGVGATTGNGVFWKYRKWASGKIELWTNSHPFTISFTKASVGVYYATESDIPVPLVETIEFASGDCTKWHYVNWASVTCNDGKNLSIRYYGLNANGDGNTIPFSFYVIGTWK